MRAEPFGVAEARDGVDKDVVGEVAEKKNHGGGEGGDHARLVGGDVFAADEKIAQPEEDGAEGVEGGVDLGQIVECHGSLVRRVAAALTWAMAASVSPSK